jgi:hypothetical protein
MWATSTLAITMARYRQTNTHIHTHSLLGDAAPWHPDSRLAARVALPTRRMESIYAERCRLVQRTNARRPGARLLRDDPAAAGRAGEHSTPATSDSSAGFNPLPSFCACRLCCGA